jgi:hypothetical protein
MLIAGRCPSWGIGNNLTRKLSSADPVQIATIKGLAACMTSFVLALFLGAQRSCLGQERCSAVQRSVSSASA